MAQVKAKAVWLDGELVPWEQANVHVMTHSLHYGLGAFEGIRCYECGDGRSAVFRLHEHTRRLLDSCKILTLDCPYSHDELFEATLATIRANDLKACYIRPIVFLGDGAMGLGATTNPTRVAIAAWTWGSYLGDEGIKNGIRARVSSFARPGVNSAMVRAKVTGQYVNSILAKREAMRDGYDEALLLDQGGFLTEGSGENVFMVRDDVVWTTPTGSSILEGITRHTVMTLLRDRGVELREKRFTRDDLYIADEIFVTGTAAEVTPIREVDGRPVGTGKPGPITKQLQADYGNTVRNIDSKHPDWYAFVN